MLGIFSEACSVPYVLAETSRFPMSNAQVLSIPCYAIDGSIYTPFEAQGSLQCATSYPYCYAYPTNKEVPSRKHRNNHCPLRINPLPTPTRSNSRTGLLLREGCEPEVRLHCPETRKQYSSLLVIDRWRNNHIVSRKPVDWCRHFVHVTSLQRVHDSKYFGSVAAC